MILHGLEIQLYIFDASSLKDKRSVIKSLINRIHQRFNVSIAEVADQEIWNKSTLGVACVSNSFKQCQQVMDSIIHFIDQDGRCEITTINDVQ